MNRWDWQINDDGVYWIPGVCRDLDGEVTKRISACLNACEGIPNEDLERVIGLGKTVKELIRIPQ
jgi:hypothetical protein